MIIMVQLFVGMNLYHPSQCTRASELLTNSEYQIRMLLYALYVMQSWTVQGCAAVFVQQTVFWICCCWCCWSWCCWCCCGCCCCFIRGFVTEDTLVWVAEAKLQLGKCRSLRFVGVPAIFLTHFVRISNLTWASFIFSTKILIYREFWVRVLMKFKKSLETSWKKFLTSQF